QLYSTPRVVAGEPLATDIVKCQVRPLVRSDYLPIQFNDRDWARMLATFPSGVCDYTRPGVDQQPPLPRQTYEDGPGTGHPIPANGALRAQEVEDRVAELGAGDGREVVSRDHQEPAVRQSGREDLRLAGDPVVVAGHQQRRDRDPLERDLLGVGARRLRGES